MTGTANATPRVAAYESQFRDRKGLKITRTSTTGNREKCAIFGEKLAVVGSPSRPAQPKRYR